MEEFAGQVGDRFQFSSWFNTLHCNDVVFPFGIFFFQQYDWIEWVEVMVYTAGFPCQPYSVLSSTRLMLSDPNARQLRAVIRNMKRTRPMEPRILSAKFTFFMFAHVIFSSTILLGLEKDWGGATWERTGLQISASPGHGNYQEKPAWATLLDGKCLKFVDDDGDDDNDVDICWCWCWWCCWWCWW